MIRLFIITFMVLFQTFVFAQKPHVYFTCDVKTVASKYGQTKHNVYEEGGYLYLKPSSYRHSGDTGGIMILHHLFMDEYFAFDMSCQECKTFGRNGKIFMETDVLCRCDTCLAEFQNICLGSNQETNNNGKYWLIQYNCYRDGDKLIVTDKILNHIGE